MLHVGRRLLIFLGVCTFILVVGVIGYIGSWIGGWQERNAQADANQVLVLPKNGDGSVTVTEGTDTFTFNKKVFAPITANGVAVTALPPTPAPTPAPPVVVVVPPSPHSPSSTGKVYIFNLPQP